MPAFNFKDFTGETINGLTVIRLEGRTKARQSLWLIKTATGSTRVIRCDKLKSGSPRIKRSNYARHGMTRTPEYRVWQGLTNRCTNPNNPSFKYYGGRGICVCSSWLESFENFYADMGPRPSPDLSIDRIDNDGNYEPSNCRWATAYQQRINQRNQNGSRS